MTIKRICNTKVVTIARNSTLKDVSRLMQQQHVGSVIVTEASNGKRRPVGIITDRDLALALVSNETPQTMKVEQVMQSRPLTVNENEGIFETILLMETNGFRRLPVVDDEGSLFGIVTTDDILRLMGEEINKLAQVTATQIRKERGFQLPTEKSP